MLATYCISGQGRSANKLLATAFPHSIFFLLLFYMQEFPRNPAFRADGLKIYPTLVIRGTGVDTLLTMFDRC